MKLTTGILITILMAGSAMGQQQGSTPSFWDTLRATLGLGAPAPKPSAQHPATHAQSNGATTATPANGKPSPVQSAVQQKGAATLTSALKAQSQPAQVQLVTAQAGRMTSAPANNVQA